MNRLITPSKQLGYSDLFLDFLNKNESAKLFYPSGSLDEVAVQLDQKSYPRKKLAEILIDQNQSFGAEQSVFDNIEKLKDEKTLTVFTGQQAGLFGGPLLVVIKALSIVKAARLYSEELNRNVIPIFWIAGDDHDYEEVNHTYLLDSNSEVKKICYETTPQFTHSTSRLKFDNSDELKKVIDNYKSTLGETDFTDELYNLIEYSYTPKDNYVSSFGKLMSKLTSSYGLVLFSPSDKRVKKLSIDFFKKIVISQDDIHRNLHETNSSIEQNGYHIQVEKKENAVDLFYDEEGRMPFLQEGDKFTVGEKSYSQSDLLNLIEQHPERFSPDVMTRPLLQSYLFPVLSQKGGAAEIAYLAQINKLFEVFDIPVPLYMARPTMTLIEKRFEKLIDQYDIDFVELTGDVETLINRILSKSFPEDIESKFNQLRDSIRNQFKDFSDTTLDFDKNLKGVSEQSIGKIDYTLNMFENKVFSAHKKQSQQTRDKIYKLYNSIYPNRAFQERSLNIGYFISKYGLDVIDFIYENIDSEQSSHCLVQLSEYNK